MHNGLPHITPVAKSLPVSSSSDYRAISVTPILSMMVERLVVMEFVPQPIPVDVLCDKFGFRPTCCTTAELIDLTHSFNHARRQSLRSLSSCGLC